MDEFPVWMSDVHNLSGAMDMIRKVAELVDRAPEANYLIHLINAGFNDLQTLALQNGIDKKVAYLIWRNPYMFAGRSTFISELLAINGLSNVIQTERYPALELSALIDLAPELVFLSSEPYPFNDEHLQEIQTALPFAKVRLVDGEMFSWYGSRLVKAVQYFFQLQSEIK